MKRAIGLLVLAGVAAAQEQHRVALAVELDHEDTRNRLVSVMSRELRALRDVVIVEESPRYSIDIVGVELKTPEQPRLGVVLSTVYFDHYEIGSIRSFLRAAQSAANGCFQKPELTMANLSFLVIASTGKKWSESLESLPAIRTRGITFFRDGYGDEAARGIVTDFDVRVLGPIRRSRQAIKDLILKQDR